MIRNAFAPISAVPAAVLLVLTLAGCRSPDVVLRRTETHMGTLVTVTAIAPRERAERALEAAFREVARVDRLLSHYRADSEVSRLNRGETLENPSADLTANLRKSIEYGRLSGGAFDITVQPILDLYDESFSVRRRAPTAEEIRRVLPAVDYSRIAFTGDGVRLGEGQKITLGGIAKGYAVDRALEAMRALGIRQALVDAGGDLRAMGRRLERDWIAALRNPRDPEDYITRIRATDRAVVTSGDYERYYDEEKTFHHIVDPRTGYSATRLISVTIVAATAFDADAISTSVFVLGLEKGLQLIESLDGVEGLLIDRDRRIIRSSGWSSFELDGASAR